MIHKDMMMKIDKDADGLAIKGYDAVSYFTDMKPMMGRSSYTYDWMGAKWQFTSEKNLNMFKANPEKYAPQYGGYCAYAVSKNMLAPVDPTAWTVVDGKLYLNNSGKVQKLWKKDIPGNIKTADKNWTKLGMADIKSDMKKMDSMKKMDNMK
jgi:YHS domain-containing protein